MQLLLFIPALLVFLYALFRLVKDDYIFIRKGISLEQSFDIAFITVWGGLFFFLNAIIYFVLLLFFVQFLYPKIMNRSLKEGVLAIVFLLLFSLIALTISLLTSLKNIQSFINPENIILTLLFL